MAFVPVGAIRAKVRQARQAKEAQDIQSVDTHDRLPSLKPEDARRFVNEVSLTAGLVIVAIGIVGAILLQRDSAASLSSLFAGLLLGSYVIFGLKIARQWEKGVVLRFGKFRALRGPGLFWVVPVVDSVSQLV